MKREVKEAFYFAYDNYMRYGFPKDELRPVSCTGVDTHFRSFLTLIDSLDMLAIVGRHHEFRRQAKYVTDHLNVDRDLAVSVFETHIRVVGGLLSAHFMYEMGIVTVDPTVDDYSGALLEVALDLADRLLPAFDTETHIPYGTVNLHSGVPSGEVAETSAAAGGTFQLEFTVLSCITKNPKYERASRLALRGLFERRSKLDLIGNHINVTSGRWTVQNAGVGAGIDSFLEYLVKSYILTGDVELQHMFHTLSNGIDRYVRRGPWYVDVHMYSGVITHAIHNSLASFYPGSLALAGRLREAKELVDSVHALFARNGALPEGFDLHGNAVRMEQAAFPLRPEHSEAIYMLYRATRDPKYIDMGAEVFRAINIRTRTRCGFAVLQDATLRDDVGVLRDQMESFLLSETFKYLYLLFDEANPINSDQQRWVFNTEGHPIPMTPEWNLDRWYDRAVHKLGGGITEGHALARPDGHEVFQCPSHADEMFVDGPIVDAEYDGPIRASS